MLDNGENCVNFLMYVLFCKMLSFLPPLNKMKFPNKPKQIKHTKIENFGGTLLNLLNKWMLNMLGCKGALNMLSVKVVKEPFYHSYPPSKLC
jgi:hypothetical protein